MQCFCHTTGLDSVLSLTWIGLVAVPQQQSFPLHQHARKDFCAAIGCFERNKNNDESACLTSDEACVANAMAFATGHVYLPQQGPRAQ